MIHDFITFNYLINIKSSVKISHIDFIKITIYNYFIGRTISMNMNYKKLVIAVLQGDDYPDVVKDLNDHGYYVTLLNSSGGFLKKKSKTIMIGVEDEKLDEVKKILKTHAGERLVTSFNQAGVGMPVVPVKLPAGGIVFFVINVESSHKY